MKNIEEKLIDLIAIDRISIPLSSMENKLKRARVKSGKSLSEEIEYGFDGKFEGERAYARISNEDLSKARGMKDAIVEFCQEFPKYGLILQGKIVEKRTISEKHLYFGVNPGSRLDSSDYMSVMESLGITGNKATELYPVLMDVSRKLSRARDEERSVLVSGSLA